MQLQVTGYKRYYMAALLFGVMGLLLPFNFIRLKMYALLVWPVGLVILSLILWRIGHYTKNYNPDEQTNEVPARFMIIFVGYLFFFVGSGFLSTLPYAPAEMRAQIIIPSSIATILGLTILIYWLISRRGTKNQKELAKKDTSFGAKIGIGMALLVTIAIALIGIVAIAKGKIGGGIFFLIPLVIFLVVFLIVRKVRMVKKLK